MSSRPSRTRQSKKSCLKDYTSSDEEISDSESQLPLLQEVSYTVDQRSRKRRKFINRIQTCSEPFKIFCLIEDKQNLIFCSNNDEEPSVVLHKPWIIPDSNIDLRKTRSLKTILPSDLFLLDSPRPSFAHIQRVSSAHFENALYLLQLKPSTFHSAGLGVFANEDIPQDSTVLHFGGIYTNVEPESKHKGDIENAWQLLMEIEKEIRLLGKSLSNNEEPY
ncbi:hypothetical protein GEMRC1_000204 [Eukaryota sp. GEM-RC1]